MLDQNDSASSAPDTNLPMEFRFEDQTIRMIFPDGEPRFVATDVCEVLGIKNPRDAIEPLDDDEKGVAKIDTLGGPQEMNVVNEFGQDSDLLAGLDGVISSAVENANGFLRLYRELRA